MALLASDPIMWERLIRLFRHLEHQNCPLFQILKAEPGWCNISGGGTEWNGTEERRRSTVVLDDRI